MTNKIKEEVERQIRIRDLQRGERRRHWKAIFCAFVLAVFGATAAVAQQSAEIGGGLTRSDLFRRFFTWSGNDLTVANNGTMVAKAFTARFTEAALTVADFGTAGNSFLSVGQGGVNAGVGGAGVTINTGSGSNGIGFANNGARMDFGAGASDYASSNGTRVTFASSEFGIDGYLYLNNAIAQGFQCSNTAARCDVGTLTDDSVTTATTPAIAFLLGANLTNTDMGWGFRNSAGTYVFQIFESGNINIADAANAEIQFGGGARFAGSNINATAMLGRVTASGSTDTAIVLTNSNALADTDRLTAWCNDGSFCASPVAFVTAGGDLTLAGNDITGSGTGSTFQFISDASDVTVTSSVAAYTFKPSVDYQLDDLLLAVQIDTGANALSVNERGDLSLGRAALTSENLTLTSFNRQQFILAPNTSAANMTVAVAALTVQPTTTPDTGDLIFEVNDEVAASKFSVSTFGPQTQVNAGTAGSGTGFTTVATGQMVHSVHKITVTNAALDVAATSDETIWTVPAKTRVLRMIADVTTTFSGGGITDMDVVCGPSAGSNGYLVTFDVDTAIGTYGDVAAEIGANLLSATYADIPSWSATTAIICRFTCAGANCSAATQGSATFYIEHLVYP